VNAAVPAQVASAGLNMSNVIVPVALKAPLMVASSLGIRLGAVVMAVCLLVTTRCSLVQTRVAALLLASPL
jgi:hypothetical protein